MSCAEGASAIRISEFWLIVHIMLGGTPLGIITTNTDILDPAQASQCFSAECQTQAAVRINAR